MGTIIANQINIVQREITIVLDQHCGVLAVRNTFQLFNGQKLVVSGSSTTTFNMGEIYGFYYQFDSELQSPDAASTLVHLLDYIFLLH